MEKKYSAEKSMFHLLKVNYAEKQESAFAQVLWLSKQNKKYIIIFFKLFILYFFHAFIDYVNDSSVFLSTSGSN